MGKNRPIILYDDKCLFCINARKRLERLDTAKRLRWEGISSFNYKKYRLKKTALLDEMHLIDNGIIYKGYYAFKHISKKIPALYLFYLVSLVPGVDFLGKLVYGIIAKHRYKL